MRIMWLNYYIVEGNVTWIYSIVYKRRTPVDKVKDWPFRIADLEKLTGISRNTIHYYLREGLLSPPRRTGKTMAYYNDHHVKELEEIRYFRDEGLSLSYIRKMMSRARKPAENTPKETAFNPERRRQIMEKAVEIFARKGYHQARVAEIAREVGVGHGTVYVYFPSKKVLFLECVDEVFQTMFAEAWETVEAETDPLKRLQKRGELILKTYPQFIDMLQAFQNMVEDDPRLETKRRELYSSVAMTVQRDLEEAIADGLIPRINAEIWSYLIVGILETACMLMSMDDRYDVDELLDSMLQLASFEGWRALVEKSGSKKRS